MAIHFVPNDPRATHFNRPRIKKPLPERNGKQVRFGFGNLKLSKIYRSTDVLCLKWQVREAALAALRTFERIDGPLKQWERSKNSKVLKVNYIAGFEINAYYSEEGLSFFQVPVDETPHFTGASTDIVAHEVGHALLDAIRPDLWDIEFLEVAAFHEAFGDCIAVLTSLADPQIRKHLVSTKKGLRQR